VIEAGLAHAAVMAAVHGAAFPHDPWTEASFATLLAQPGVAGLIDPRGGVLLIRTIVDEAEVLTLGVATRRQGIGRALMIAGMDQARAAGAVVMHLEVAADNAAALGLYGSLGFTRTGRRKTYYPNGQDALLFAKPLSPS
jgi:ribosomal-protein-alanine N-acetyltransferase